MGKVHAAIQDSLNSWGNLLIATGGALQLSKCFYSIIFYKWTIREWKYANNSLKGKFGITVPLPNGSKAAMEHKSVGHAEKTLGAITSPDGNSSASIQMMQDKAQQWINSVQKGHLHHCNIWFLLKVQFWPRIGHGLCSFTASYQELNHALHRKYYQILLLGGIVQTTTAESRTIDTGFFGVGLPHLGVEALLPCQRRFSCIMDAKQLQGDLCICPILYYLSNWASHSIPFRNIDRNCDVLPLSLDDLLN
jgi:hypothetical protein